MQYTLFLDTNALLNLGTQAFKEPFYISQQTLQEVEHIKTSSSKDNEVKYKARNVSKLLKQYSDQYTVIPTNETIYEIIRSKQLDITPDNIILAAAVYCCENDINILVVTDDINCDFIAKKIFMLPTKGIDEINLVKNINEYKGYKEIVLSDEQMAYFYEHTEDNVWDCVINEYIVIKNQNDQVVDYRRWTGTCYVSLSIKTINNMFMGKIKPRNMQQHMAFDMLQNKNLTIKVISGGMGTGKDYIMIANALKLIEDGKYDKLLYVRNPIVIKDIKEIGFLPGEKDSKLRPFSMPLADHLGGETGLDMQILNNKIEIEYIGYLRGRDIKNTIIYCTECENLTKEHVQLLIGRVGEGSALWLNGDFKQTDSPIFRMNNGLLTVVQKLAGRSKFGYIQLQRTERSETAAMTELLD